MFLDGFQNRLPVVELLCRCCMYAYDFRARVGEGCCNVPVIVYLFAFYGGYLNRRLVMISVLNVL